MVVLAAVIWWFWFLKIGGSDLYKLMVLTATSWWSRFLQVAGSDYTVGGFGCCELVVLAAAS